MKLRSRSVVVTPGPARLKAKGRAPESPAVVAELQRIKMYARMAFSDDPEEAAVGDELLREVAARSMEATRFSGSQALKGAATMKIDERAERLVRARYDSDVREGCRYGALSRLAASYHVTTETIRTIVRDKTRK